MINKRKYSTQQGMRTMRATSSAHTPSISPTPQPQSTDNVYRQTASALRYHPDRTPNQKKRHTYPATALVLAHVYSAYCTLCISCPPTDKRSVTIWSLWCMSMYWYPVSWHLTSLSQFQEHHSITLHIYCTSYLS